MVQGRVDLMTLPAPEVARMSDVGTFRTTIAMENPLRRGERRVLPDTLVDTGAELTWAPTAVLEALGIARQKRLGFRTADGRAVFRDIGYAIVHAGGTNTIDEVVFAEPGDMILLGARSLEGLNLRVDARTKQLVDAGPIVAALAMSA
jgi:predicted aspartyl protease